MYSSSGGGLLPVAGVLTYACTKTFMRYLGIGMNYETGGKVDSMTINFGEVNTKMCPEYTGPLIISAKHAVQCALRDVGRCDETDGCIRHEFLNSSFRWMASNCFSLLEYVFFTMTKADFESKRNVAK